ncbi:GntR family transcriptional regulator [Sporolituus thermophilus]|uniref:DNA-binding transcriptional regulator, GntR family n=1 Tax=Sporolituus thermophilus DSM 23256 TaxID=1123285 RepID=A0A1G7K9I8_9FIRM|nr:GntR family transcriptional regulator [Sporolituus thermophilus]SDF33720.1 DNA-binding transcriptional regulator, GntR family [Sporolituus thermophilus DSM 23256]
MFIIERSKHESAREYVYRLLKFNIINLTLPPGQSLSEQDIADQLNVSRTPVREAFIKLAQENLLDILPQKGTYVSLIDIDHVEESKFVRETLEREVVQQACSFFPSELLFELQSNVTLQELCIKEKNYHKFFELDESMHGTIFKGCKKARTWAMMQQMNTHYNRVRMLNLAVGYDWDQLIFQHQELVRAIREKDVALGKQTIDKHLNKVVVDLEYLRKEYEHYFLPPKAYSVNVVTTK